MLNDIEINKKSCIKNLKNNDSNILYDKKNDKKVYSNKK